MKIAFLSDFHVPFVDARFSGHAYRVLSEEKPDVVILGGDVVDFYQISRFSKDPVRVLKLQDDLDMTHAIIMDIKKITGEVIYLIGNHEERLEKYLRSHPEIHGLKALSLYNLLYGYKIENFRIERDVSYGGFLFTHGEIVRKYSSYSAKAHYDKYHQSGVIGHTHRAGMYFYTVNGNEHVFVEAGTMCRLDLEYVYYPNWQNGFVIIDFDRNILSLHTKQKLFRVEGRLP